MSEKIIFEPTPEQFGIFWKYLSRPEVTDVDYNGQKLWITDLKEGRYCIFVHRENGWQCIFSGGKDRILFADCGCGRDKKTQNSLKNADVIVAGIHTYPSEWQEIIRNFTVRHKKVLYLVEGYALHASRLKTDMMDRYRIAPEQIGYIPQNGELEWVSAQGKIDNFMKSWRQKSRTERNENFFEEMEHNLFLLMKQMEKNENGGYQLWNR